MTTHRPTTLLDRLGALRGLLTISDEDFHAFIGSYGELFVGSPENTKADYDAGIAPTCAVADTFTGTLGDPAEPLTGAALSYLQTGSCPVAGTPARASTQHLRRFAEPGDRPGMTAD